MVGSICESIAPISYFRAFLPNLSRGSARSRMHRAEEPRATFNFSPRIGEHFSSRGELTRAFSSSPNDREPGDLYADRSTLQYSGPKPAGAAAGFLIARLRGHRPSAGSHGLSIR